VTRRGILKSFRHGRCRMCSQGRVQDPSAAKGRHCVWGAYGEVREGEECVCVGEGSVCVRVVCMFA
jgi:hypothetical protein